MALIKMVIQLRRASTAEWLANKDVVPAQGEPCFDYELNTLKIGDGKKTYEQLEPIGSAETVSVSADGTSIVLEDGVFKLAGFDAAEVGAQPRKNAEGFIEWVIPAVDEQLESLLVTVDGLQSDVSSLQGTITTIREIVTPSGDDAVPLLTRIESLETKMDGTGEGTVDAKIDAKIKAFASNLTNDGKVNTLMELISYVESHGKEAADMASDIKTLHDLVGGASVSGQITAAIGVSEEKAKAVFEHVKYDISHKPEGTIVDYRDKEIRVMCPADTKWVKQDVGGSGNGNMYYMGFKAYAPEGAVSFKEDDNATIEDQTMYYFENNDFAGIDEYGRKYSIVWLALASYDEDTNAWSYFGEKSSAEKYVGWYYSVEWYDVNGVKISSDKIRINLTNESCHDVIEPYYMSGIVKEVAVNGTLLDVVDGRVDITIPEQTLCVKGSDEIEVAEDGTLSIKSISFSKIMQSDDEIFIMDGGGAV